jgi:putative flavoprotein involved in K+ transport
MFEWVGVAVIGAGQAGLAISYYLTQQARTHVVLEKDRQVGSAWRHGRWDSFTLVTPNWSVRLPGSPYRGDEPDGFMKRAEVVSHLEQYASSFGAPVRFGVTVASVDSAPGGGYLVSTADGDAYAAANVVVATGSFQFPRPTKLSEAFLPHILQVHSSRYRNPDGLPPGAVLVVGSADTGCQIAEELYESGRQVFLCVGRSPRRPRRYRGKDVMFWGVTLGGFDQTADQLPDPGARFAANPHITGKNGGYTLNLHHFARNGVVLLGRLVDVRDNTIVLALDLHENLAFADKGSDDFKNNVDAFVRETGMDVPGPRPDPIDEVRSDAGENAPTTLDLQAAGITSVIWANGYGFDYSWVHLPVLDSWGYPIQQRGVTRFPGLYFLGMNLLHSRKSGILLGVGEDAAHVAADIASTNPMTT